MPDERYPGYDVLAKRHTSSWNAQTRRVIEERLATPHEPRFFTTGEFRTLVAITERITPQPPGRPPVPVAALVDDKLVRNRQDGYRGAGMPREREAWQRGLAAIEAEARAAHSRPFHELPPPQQDHLLKQVERGDAHNAAWAGMPPKTFWKERLISDIVHAYWSHPTSWNEIGWGGPASPRGYVRTGYDDRDPWEAAESDGDPELARWKNRRVG